MTTVSKLLRTLLISCFTAMITFSANVFAEAGQVLFVLGQAQVVRVDGSMLSAVKGLSIENGDVIKTENNGQVQLKMVDGALLAIRPNSEFVIENYQYNKDVNTDRSFYKLIKGGFRSVTGKIGETKKSSYGVKTPVATIGIRGTDYTARYCEFDCASLGVDNGLYVNVLTGGVSLNNDGGSVSVGPTEFGFVADSMTTPTLVDQVPAELLFASAAPTSTPQSGSTSSNSTVANVVDQTITDSAGNTFSTTNFNATSSQPSSSTAVSASTDANVVASSSTTVAESTASTTSSDSSSTTTSSTTTQTTVPDPLRSNIAFSGKLSGIDENKISSNLDTEFVLNSTTHQLTSFSYVASNGAKTRYDIGTAANIDVGHNATSNVSWGRWANGVVNVTDANGNVTTSSLDANSQLHWIATNPDNIAMVLPSSGTASYGYASGFGTATTDGNGHTGGLYTTTSLTADFSNTSAVATINGYIDRPNDTINQYDWTISANSLSINNGQFSGTGTFTSNHPGLLSAGAANVNGAFTQPLDTNGVPQGATLSYSATAVIQPDPLSSNENTSIQGVAYLQRQ